MGILNKFAADENGNTSETTLIANTQVTAASGNATVTDFGGTVSADGVDTRIDLEVANEDPNNPGNPDTFVKVDRIELPAGGTIMKSYDTPIRITQSQFFRTRYQQETEGRVSSTLTGDTVKQGTQADISDI